MVEKKRRPLVVIPMLIFFILANFFLSELAESWPLFLDTTFTIMAGALLGFYPAIITGLATSTLQILLNGHPYTYFLFGIVNILMGVLMALLVKRKKFESPIHAFWVILILTISSSIIGSLIVFFLFGGFINDSIDHIVRSIVIAGQSVFTAVISGRFLINLADKGIGVTLTFIIFKLINKQYQKRQNGSAKV